MTNFKDNNELINALKGKTTVEGVFNVINNGKLNGVDIDVPLFLSGYGFFRDAIKPLVKDDNKVDAADSADVNTPSKKMGVDIKNGVGAKYIVSSKEGDIACVQSMVGGRKSSKQPKKGGKHSSVKKSKKSKGKSHKKTKGKSRGKK